MQQKCPALSGSLIRSIRSSGGKSISSIVYSDGVKTGLFIVTRTSTCCGCPARWTSVEAEDPFIVVSAGRSHFRAADLIDLAALIAALRRGEAADGV